jgi:hypothetical protein
LPTVSPDEPSEKSLESQILHLGVAQAPSHFPLYLVAVQPFL